MIQRVIKIATWNINSIRARIEQLHRFVVDDKIDILLLQETKCQDKDFPVSLVASYGLNYYFSGQKSYNGVAILSKIPMDVEYLSLPLYDLQKEDNEARYIETTCTIHGKFFRFASIYVPNGQSVLTPNTKLEDSERFLYKVNFYKRIQNRLKALNESLNDEYVVLGGDFNVAQEEIDLHNPEAQNGEVGFHPIEREQLREIKKTGLIDCFRFLHNNKTEYTWWDYRTRAFDRDLGWRIDYMLGSKLIQPHLKSCYVNKEVRSYDKPSDHAPLVIEVLV